VYGVPARTRRELSWAGALLAVVAVLALLLVTVPAGLTTVDRAVGSLLVFHGDGSAITVLQVLTAPGAEDIRYPILLTVAGFLLWRRRWRLAAFVAVTALGVSPVNRALKADFERPRPSYAGTSVTAGDWSFPSGHASGAAVLTGVLFVLVWPHVRQHRVLAGAVAALGAVTIAWTRMALGVHYLSDVVAGLALGGAVVLLALVVFDPLRPRTPDPAPSGASVVASAG